MSEIPVCVIHGRFQPLHDGHMEYLLAGMSRCRHLVIGITNPDPWQTKDESADENRGLDLSNPCTFYERLMMIERALSDSGVTRDLFRIVPFPISFPERIGHYVPTDAEFLLTIYDKWGEEKLRRLRDLGLRTHLLWRRTEKVTTGTFVRDAIASGRTWEHLVPAATAKVVREFNIDARMRRLSV